MRKASTCSVSVARELAKCHGGTGGLRTSSRIRNQANSTLAVGHAAAADRARPAIRLRGRRPQPNRARRLRQTIVGSGLRTKEQRGAELVLHLRAMASQLIALGEPAAFRPAIMAVRCCRLCTSGGPCSRSWCWPRRAPGLTTSRPATRRPVSCTQTDARDPTGACGGRRAGGKPRARGLSGCGSSRVPQCCSARRVCHISGGKYRERHFRPAWVYDGFALMSTDLSPLWISLETASAATALAFVLGIAAAGAMHRYRGPGGPPGWLVDASVGAAANRRFAARTITGE